jgi:hypothetical protein
VAIRRHKPEEIVAKLRQVPSKSPELNPVENIWQFMRDNWLSNRIFKSNADILDHCCFAWNRIIKLPWVEQGRDPPVAVASVLSRQFDHVSNQQVLVHSSSGHVALRRSVLAKHTASPALRNTKLVANQVDAPAATRGA